MTRHFIIIVVFLTLKINAYGQIFKGATTDKGHPRTCTLKINPDSSVVLVYYSKANESYTQYLGKIVRKKDSLFHVSAKMTFGTFGVIWLPTINRNTLVVHDTNFFSITPLIFDIFKPVKIIYANGQSIDYLSPERLIPLDKKAFNQKKGCNYYYIQTNAKDIFTNQKLTFKCDYGTSLSFINGDSVEFDIIVLKNKAWSVDNPSSQIEHFTLIKK